MSHETAFNRLPLKPELLKNLNSLNFTEMTEVQALALPLALDGKDIIAQAKTGSGKTAAFGLSILNTLQVDTFRVQSLVLCPTRELADQVAKELRRLARSIHNIKILTLCGGMPFGPQIGSLEHGAHIVVGTPGRIEEHLRKGTLILEHVNQLVLDEADRMLDMGFQETLDKIISKLPQKRQSLLFSATYPAEIEEMAARVLQNPSRITVETSHDDSTIEQLFFPVRNHEHRLEVLQKLLSKYRPESTIVFCNTKADTDEVAQRLQEMNFSAVALHGDMEQRERNQTLVCFANKSASILVATDVAARGIDIAELDAVVNFQIAKTPDVHTHRIGRTGRAGKQGIAFTLFSEKEAHRVAQLPLDNDPFANPIQEPDDAFLDEPAYQASMVTLQIDAGKKQKIRPGDILGALTGGDAPLQGQDVGKISIFDQYAYFAVSHTVAKKALKKVTREPLKGRKVRVRQIRN